MELQWKRSTFNDWVREYSSTVKDVPIEELELNGYQSPYLIMFNILRESGWRKSEGKWVSPRGDMRYLKINEAYISQKRYERLEEMGNV